MSEGPEVTNSFTLIEGNEAIRRYFGRWPTFHDAEIIEMHLHRGELSWLRVDTAIDGFHPEQKTGIVVFRFSGVLDLELNDFSNQNVVSSIDFEKTVKGIKVLLGPCYGLQGWLEVSGVSVELAL